MARFYHSKLKSILKNKKGPYEKNRMILKELYYASCGSRTHIAGTGILSAIHYTNDASDIYYRKNSIKVKHLL